MDMQIGVLCGVFSIIASLIVYAVLSFYSIKEDSFDEARANRRKLIKEYLDQSRSTVDKTKPKKTKKSSKKVKDKKPEPVAEKIEEKKEVKPAEAPKEVPQPNKEKDMVVAKKPEVVSKAEKSAKPKAQNVEKEESNTTVPSVVSDSASKKVQEKKLKAKVVEKQPEPEVQSQPIIIPKEPEKKVKLELKSDKKKSETSTVGRKVGGTEKQDINVNSILTLIRKAEFSRSEIQLLIDTLLNSCEDETSEWFKVKKLDSGKQDSTVKLKKQLSDIEASLKNEKQITLSLQNKLKELRSEMAADKTSVTMLKETVAKLQQDKDDLLYEKSEISMKLKAVSDERDEFQEQLNKEMSKAQQQQKLDDDRHHETVLALKDQINKISSQLEEQENENASLKSNVNYLVEESMLHENCEGQIAGLEQALHEASEKVVEKENELSNLKEHIDSLTARNENLKKEKLELTRQRDSLTSQLSNAHRDVEYLKEELESVSLKLAELEDTGENTENGDVNNCYDTGHDPINCQLMLDEKENLLKQVSSDLNKNVENLKVLKQELLETKNERDKLKSLFEQANSEISTVKAKLSKISSRNDECEEVISQLRNNVNEKNDELNSLKGELEKYKQRNNELRNKNWKVVEALSTAEKALQNKLKSEEVENGGNNYKNIEELKSNVNTFVRRLFPDITIQEYKGHFNEWLRSVEETVTSNNLKYCSQDLQSQNTQLQSLVAHYKNIITDTEDILNKLQNHVEVEELKWKEEMSCLQREVDSLRALQRNTS